MKNIKTNNDIINLINTLKNTYPNAKGGLIFKNGFELGICLILAAQCTDIRVNKIAPILFEKYENINAFLKADLKNIEKIIYSCGFYKNKAKNIYNYCQILSRNFNSKLPSNIQALMTLPGIGRKSANILMLEIFNTPVGIAVDTHVKRLSNRIGLSNYSNPNKIEQDLLKIIPNKYFKDVNHIFVLHGRNVCISRNPKCFNCSISNYCNYYKHFN